jgi:hypothetical protein
VSASRATPPAKLFRLTPSVADVERIAERRDPVIRNLQITQCYHELSQALAARTEGGPANWCTFATWASKQAGGTIRKEDLARAFERLFARSPEAISAGDSAAASVASLGAGPAPERLRDALWRARVPDSAFERASDAVARGNRKVFEEIGRAFASFLALLGTGGSLNPNALAAFREGLRPGAPPTGQGYLRQAFSSYAQAIRERDPKARAELVLLANLAIGWHEQRRLQPEISEALDAPFAQPVKLRRELLRQLAGLRPGLALRLLRELVRGRRSAVIDVLDELDRRVKQIAHGAVTEVLMTLSLPGETLSLARDVPGVFATELRTIENTDLRALLARVDPTPDTTRGSGARDWSDLEERIHYIADLFRVYQDDPKLLGDPFTAEQAAMIKAGRRPAGAL